MPETEVAAKTTDNLSPIEMLRNFRAIQFTSGNWDYAPYMQGMANGLELALSLFEDRDPVFLDPPAKWLSEKENKKENKK